MSSPLKKDSRHALEAAIASVRDTLTAALRPLSALVEQRLAEAVAPLPSSFQQEIKRAIDAILPPSGTFFGDVLILFHGQSDDDREAALERLAQHFPRSAVFHPLRWGQLEDKYREYEATFGAPAWSHLIKSGLLLACQALPGDLPLIQVRDWLRKEARKEIERALLDGYTRDKRMARATIPLPDTPEPPVGEEPLGTFSEVEDWLSLPLAKLTVDEVRLLKLVDSGYTLAEAAPLLGVSHAAVRQRFGRLRKKILEDFT